MRREGPVPSTTTGRACPRNQTDIGDIVAVDRERFMATVTSVSEAKIFSRSRRPADLTVHQTRLWARSGKPRGASF